MRPVPIAITFAAAVAAGAMLYPFLAAGSGPGFLPHDDAAVVAEGRVIYDNHCAACHGIGLEGQPDWRERDEAGYLPAPPHDATGHTWHHADQLLFDITKYGTEAIVGGDYRSNMIGFGDILSDDEIIAVLAYIKSTWPARIREIHDGINENAELFSQ